MTEQHMMIFMHLYKRDSNYLINIPQLLSLYQLFE